MRCASSLNILVKELLQLRRDPKILPILFIAPVLQLVILGYAATTDISTSSSRSATSTAPRPAAASSSAFTASTYFRLVARGGLPRQRSTACSPAGSPGSG